MIVGNAGLLERLLTNLIRNALVFTPAGGRLEVSVERRNSRVRTTVADTGPGIPEADLPHIFERFYIGDSSRSKARDGSGLGLAICKRIVELHGGTIGVRSATGAGSEFYFDVPRAGGSDRIS
jgi:signal transduction histidine kinase